MPQPFMTPGQASYYGQLGGSAISGIFGIANTGLNYLLSQRMAEHDREENYRYNELAAENADARTRALYQDFYSPQALMRQYKAAGLSPSMMFGGTPGQGGTSGSMGGGAHGPQAVFAPNSLLDAAQVANLFAQAQKTKAETKNIEQDTINKQLQQQWQEMQNNEHSIGFKLTTSYLITDDNNTTSLFNIATETDNYEQFVDIAKKCAEKANNTNLKLMIDSEAGQKEMHSIFMRANRMERDIATLSEETVSAKFQQNILNCLSQKGFAEQNADTALKQLEAAAESADLTKQQKEAWNNIINRLRKKNETTADIIMVAAMILNQHAPSWKINL